ncbi:MAG TPA: hypothetical protein VKT72_06875 [Candidatus Baltobacteraceae bacterium]|nr:hypothetical protein [Candidatus Baltobacteraceae bacterium]
MKPVVRMLFIVAFSAIAIAFNASDLTIPWHPYGGFKVGTLLSGRFNAFTVPGTRRGETLDVRAMTPEDRFSVGRATLSGRTLRLPLTSRRVMSVVVQPLPRSLLDNATNAIEIFATFLYIIIAAALVLLRPAPATWAFYAFSYGFWLFAATPNTWPFPFAVASQVLVTVAASIAPAAFVSFAIRFPNAKPNAPLRAFERILLLAWTPLLAAWSLFVSLGFVFGAIVSPVWTSVAVDAAVLAVFAAGIVVLVARYANADVSERNRLQWVVGGFAVGYVPWLTLTFFSGGWTTLIPFSPAAANLCIAWEVMAPIALAYTVLKHRLFDLRFVLSRALVYAVLTSVTVGLLALVDWAFAHWLEQSRFALLVELALAVAIGAALTSVHRRVERFLNSVVFRAQTLALRALRRFAHETDLFRNPDHLLEQTYDALRKRLECDYVAIYTAEGSSFALATPAADSTPHLLTDHDSAVLPLRRWHEALECDEPEHPLQGALLLPMTALGQLVGFIVCGPKRDRTHYLPEEIETLSLLTHRTGSTYALLTMAETTPLPVTP